jgi:hypothetical protein
VAETGNQPGYVELSLGKTAAIWWAWTWRWILFTGAGIFVLNLPLMMVSLILGGTHGITLAVNLVGGFFIVCVAQVYTLWNLFGKEFRGFELCLETKPPVSAGGNIFAPSLRDAIRIWWCWFWKYLLVHFGGSFVAGLAVGIAGSQAGWTPETINAVAIAAGLVVSLAGGLLLLSVVLQQEFRHFRIRLLRASPPAGPGLSLS